MLDAELDLDRPTTTASSTTSPTARRCAGSPASPPSSRTSPRSSTASCASSGSCWSASGPRAPSQDAENSLAELAALAETAGSQVLEALIQRRDKPDAATYIGSGKARELRDIVVATGADTVICDGELTPGQLSQLEDVVKVKVIDRTALILDIFAQHASSREGKAQVVAGADAVHAAAAARLGRVDVPAGRRRGRLGVRRRRHPRPG